MSTTVKVAHVLQVALEELVSDEDFELFGIDPKPLSNEDYGISIGDSTGNFFIIHGTPHQLQKFVASLMTVVRIIAHDGEDVNP